MTGDKKTLDKLGKRVYELEQKLTDPDWAHVNNPVKYAQGAYKRICALEREVESRVCAGQRVRERLDRVEKRVASAHQRRADERLNYRVGIIERQDQRRDIKRRALAERRLRRSQCRSDCCRALGAWSLGAGIVVVLGFAIYGVSTLILKFV